SNAKLWVVSASPTELKVGAALWGTRDPDPEGIDDPHSHGPVHKPPPNNAGGEPGLLDVDISIHLTKSTTVPADPQSVLLVTSRRVCCCGDEWMSELGPFHLDCITYEKPMLTRVTGRLTASRSLTLFEANQLRHDIGRQLLQSQQDPDRYAAGTVTFATSA